MRPKKGMAALKGPAPPASAVIQETSCSSAEELLEHLSPQLGIWGPNPQQWMFRGHERASWRLVAKAFRVSLEPYKPFGVPCDLSTGQEWDVQGKAQKTLLARFVEALDRAGLSVPTTLPAIEYEAMRPTYEHEPPHEAMPIVALAQHYGLPTALLDWSRQSRVGAYFAASDAARTLKERNPEPDAHLVVWGLNRDFVEQAAFCRDDEAELSLETAPAASNPNLHAQQGLFTRSRGEFPGRYSVDEFVLRVVQRHVPNHPLPLMRRVLLPRRAAPKLLRLLAYEGVHGATMFPGFDGVIRAMKEQALWDIPPDGVEPA